MKIYAKYKTNIKDNLKFKLISGDNNLLHYDKKFLVNTSFTYPLTQGQLIIILSLLNLKKFKIINNLSEINLIEAKFIKPSIIGENLFFKYNKKQNKIYVKISNYFEDKIIMILSNVKDNNANKKIKKKKIYNFLNLNIYLDKEEKKLIRQILEISKDVGNYKSKLNLLINFRMNKNKSLTNHKNFLVKFNANFINLKKISYNFESDINFLSFNKIFRPNRYFYKSKFLKDKLNGKKVLILGGTSDIGRIIIGFLKKNKIDLNFTYFKNKKKALKICKDFSINKNNLLFYNLKNKINKKLVKKIFDCEIIIFLMTPKIFRGRYKFFNFNFFQELNKFYIAELNKFIEILVKSKKKYSLILPSSKIINYNYESNLEYSYSKLLMEKYSKSINKNFKRINVITPRLEAFKTKQTQFILGANNNINDLIKKLFYKI